MTAYKPGDILLVQLPFSDYADGKQRPAVVVSPEKYNVSLPDIIIMAITSQSNHRKTFGTTEVRHWQHAGLLKPSWIKPVIVTIEQTIIKKALGKLHKEDLSMLKSALRDLLFPS
jgi:mRNA interferase MazF